MQPVIGITTYGRTEHPAPSEHYAEHYTVPTAYVDAVRRAGGVPVLLPPGEDHWESWIDAVDGIILSGGTDVAPRHYGGDPADERIEVSSDERDDTEMALCRALADSTTPTLLICRGPQVLNVALGGTLHAHLPDVITLDIHRDHAGMWTTHDVEATPGSLVARAMGTPHATTYSGHHQGIDQVAARLTVSAVAPDGIIEAIELPDHPWLIGVQWHPEVTAHSDSTQQALFDDLIRHA